MMMMMTMMYDSRRYRRRRRHHHHHHQMVNEFIHAHNTNRFLAYFYLYTKLYLTSTIKLMLSHVLLFYYMMMYDCFRRRRHHHQMGNEFIHAQCK